MIKVTKINGEELVVNAELIETVKATPDTIIFLTTGRKVIVLDSIDEIVEKVITYRQKTLAGLRIEKG